MQEKKKAPRSHPLRRKVRVVISLEVSPAAWAGLAADDDIEGAADLAEHLVVMAGDLIDEAHAHGLDILAEQAAKEKARQAKIAEHLAEIERLRAGGSVDPMPEGFPAEVEGDDAGAES